MQPSERPEVLETIKRLLETKAQNPHSSLVPAIDHYIAELRKKLERLDARTN